MKRFALLLGLVAIALLSLKTVEKKNPEELGTVNWLRNFDDALLESEKSQKPVLILFQEIPGCSTCRNYGHDVLSNPLLVEAIEQYFVPLAIYNNKGGEDARILKKYEEPSWNNPVVRIVDDKGDDLTERLSGNYSALGLHSQMREVLKKRGLRPDLYFNLLGDELAAKGSQVETAYFSMFCFWSGEGHLGSKDGVIETEPGFKDGKEVVAVTYNKEVISFEDLTAFASKASCKKTEAESAFREDKDPQYYLKQTPFRYLPLSPIQRTKINAALAAEADPSIYLSPKQKQWLREGKMSEVLYTLPISESWKMRSMGI